MITYINDRCNAWAEWTDRRLKLGMGYPKESPYTRLAARGGNSGYEVIVDEQAWEIHKAVQTLPDYLKDAVTEFYLGKGTTEQKARACRCCRRTFFYRIDAAHVRLLDWLNAEAAGLHRAKGAANSALQHCTVPV